jgi:SAM-dependent methyltransferase
MTETSEPNSAQAAQWNDTAGRTWAELQAMLDDVLRPFETLLTEQALATSGRDILDIGCGAGATTLAIAQALGDEARCVGVDISAPLIAAARARAASAGMHHVAFIKGDAQAYPFEDQSFDIIVSRFGVMFFDDPVAAFRNLRRAARDGATLAFAAWRSPAENDFMTAAERAVAPLLPSLPERSPDAPGQFAFARRERIEQILAASGWGSISVDPVDATCTLPAADMLTYATRMGPLGLIFQDLDRSLQQRIAAALRAAFNPYVRGDTVCFTAACWMVTARASV